MATEPQKIGVGVELIAAERARQVLREGYHFGHDDTHAKGEMAIAAACYAVPRGRFGPRAKRWPFDADSWKPSPDDRVRELVKAGALIAAEIDRLARLSSSEGSGDV